MSRAWARCGAALFAVLLAGLASASIQTLDASFERHAELSGSTQVSASQWALLLFDSEQGRADFGFEWTSDATQTNITHADGEFHPEPGSNIIVPGINEPQTQMLAGPLQGTLHFAHAWSSLYLEADNITYTGSKNRIDTNRIYQGNDARSFLADDHYPSTADNYPSLSPGAGVALSIVSTESGPYLDFTLLAKGVHLAAWHNATINCQSTSCPNPARTWLESYLLPANNRIALDPYITLSSTSGTLEGMGRTSLAVLGGNNLNLATNGTLRLPEAQLLGACPGGPCPNPDGRTFLASGDFTLQHLRGADDAGRLQGSLSGAFNSASFDETHQAAYTQFAVAGGLTLLAVAVLISAKFAWTPILRLFVRSARPPALDSARRRTAYEAIRANPGLSFRELQRKLDWPVGTLSNHLRRLTEAGLVSTRPHKNTTRYFEASTSLQDTWLPLAHLQNADARRLFEWLHSHPETSQTELAHMATHWGWSRTRTRRRLADLESANLVQRLRVGKQVRYTAIAHGILAAQPTSASV